MPPSPSPSPQPGRSSFDSSSSLSSGASLTHLTRISVNFNKLLTAFFSRYDPNRISEIDSLLKRNEGKETKLMLMLALRYDTSNPLNAVFVKYFSRLSVQHLDDYHALTTLYLSVFRPEDLCEVDVLLDKYEGNEDEMFHKLASNFRAINPLKIPKLKHKIDYKKALITFYEDNDPDKLDEVEDTLAKCSGKEAILFSVLANKYQASNGLDPIFEAKLEDSDCNDYLSLLQLYLSIYHPAYLVEAESMLSKHGSGGEERLFAMLATKFRATNPLTIWNKIEDKKDDQTFKAPTVPQQSPVMITSH